MPAFFIYHNSGRNYHVFTTEQKFIMLETADMAPLRDGQRLPYYLTQQPNKRRKKAPRLHLRQGAFLVEVTGFEPATFWSRSELSLMYNIQLSQNNGL